MIKIKPRWLLAIAGILALIVGLFCLINPLYTYVNLVRFAGLGLLLMGVALQISSASAHIGFRLEKKSMLAESISDYTFGILLIFNPFLTFLVFPILIGAWMFVLGLMKIFLSLLVRRTIRGWLF